MEPYQAMSLATELAIQQQADEKLQELESTRLQSSKSILEHEGFKYILDQPGKNGLTYLLF